MNWLRTLAAVLVTALFLVIAVGDTVAQQPKTKTKTESKVDPKNIPEPQAGEVYDVDCPKCGNKLEVRDTMTTITCPKCNTTHTVSKDGSGGVSLKSAETSENKWKKPLLIGGGVLLVLGLLGVVLKKTVLAPAPVKKKKKKKRPVDDEDEDDRPRKKKRPIVVEDEDEAPRKVKKKPRIVDDEDE